MQKRKTFKRRSTYKRGGMYTKPEFIINNRVNWNFLSRNPNAIHLLENNQDRIDWRALSGNPNAIDIISRYDYNRMTQKIEPLLKNWFRRSCIQKELVVWQNHMVFQ